MSHAHIRDPEAVIVNLANELDHLAKQPRLAQGDYEAQAIGALCRAAAAILQSLPHQYNPMAAPNTGHEE